MQKLLVANRAEIALRIIGTAKVEGISTDAICTSSDALSRHVAPADEALLLAPQSDGDSTAYVSAAHILALCQAHQVTLLHGGYGFLSENAGFTQAIIDTGITWLGPPLLYRDHGPQASRGSDEGGRHLCAGFHGTLLRRDVGAEVAGRIGYPVMLKASAEGGGIGMVICEDEGALGAGGYKAR
ncbi:Pre-ATP-grasp domain-containing protein [Mycena olivaceomarginata]|nr:Pre-ATP-grasp domain-containing protein [Mycena olivaceomarginata]